MIAPEKNQGFGENLKITVSNQLIHFESLLNLNQTYLKC